MGLDDLQTLNYVSLEVFFIAVFKKVTTAFSLKNDIAHLYNSYTIKKLFKNIAINLYRVYQYQLWCNDRILNDLFLSDLSEQ